MTTPVVVRHPAKFSGPVLEQLRHLVDREVTDVGRLRVLDPFAGVGGIHTLATPTVMTVGVELEPEWANQHPATLVGNALDLPFANNSFDAVITSPCYGNRLADHHEARDMSIRHTYRHALGRPPSGSSSAVLQWGEAYRDLAASGGRCNEVSVGLGWGLSFEHDSRSPV
jgi:hypothetical protein